MQKFRFRLWLLGSLLFLGTAPSSQAAVRIMCLGDSITASAANRASYRYWLWQNIKNNPAGADFVGSQTQNHGGPPLYADFDKNHEGHWGWRADEIAASVPTWAAAHQPDIVLLHIGSNDLLQGESVAQAANDIRQIINKLRNINPNITVLLAQIIPSTRPELSQASQLNAQIAGISSSMTTAPSPIVLVNQYSGFNPNTDTYDGVHPNQSGEIKMANRFLTALNPILNGPPGATTPLQPLDCTTDTSPTFSWTAARSATRYRLLVEHNGVNFVDEWIEGATSWTPGNAWPIGEYHWRVRPSNVNGDGLWSTGVDFSLEEPLAQPASLNPGGAILDRTPTFSWGSISGASWYQIWIKRNGEDYLTPWVEGTNQWTPEDGLPCGNYEWRVTSWKACGTGPWSEPNTFTIDCCVPEIPTDIQAASGPGSEQATYSFTGDSCANWIQLWVNREGVFWENRWFNTGVQSGTVDLTMDNQSFGNYDYWIRGWNPDGFGPWSDKYSLALGMPVSLTPDGATLPDRIPTLTWSSSGASWSQVWVNRNGATYHNQWVEGTNQWIPNEELPCGNYEWWVRSWKPGGIGPWSESATFTINCCVPVNPTGMHASSGPGAGQVTYSLDADSCATWYQLWINRSDTSWKSEWFNRTNHSGTVELIIDNQPVGNYDYWIRGYSPDGMGPWSGQHFLTLGEIIPTYPLGTATTPDRLQWDKASGHTATWFHLYINDGSGNLHWKGWVPISDTATNGADRFYRLPATLPSGSYQWWIQTWEPGHLGPWSGEATVTVP